MNDALVIIPSARGVVEAVIAPGSMSHRGSGGGAGVGGGMGRRSAKRCLFGRADPKRTDAWLAERLAEIRAEQEQRWGFDFHADVPCASGLAGSEYMITAVSANSVPSFYRQSYYHANTTNSGSSHQRYNERSHHQHDLDAHSTASSDSENQSPCLMDGAFEGDLDSSGQSDVSFTGNSPRAPSSTANNGRISSQIHDGGHGGDGYNRRHNAAANSATVYRTSTPLKQTKLTAYMKVQSSRKRLQHGVKTSDLRSTAAGGGSSAGSRRVTARALAFSGTGTSSVGNGGGGGAASASSV